MSLGRAVCCSALAQRRPHGCDCMAKMETAWQRWRTGNIAASWKSVPFVQHPTEVVPLYRPAVASLQVAN